MCGGDAATRRIFYRRARVSFYFTPGIPTRKAARAILPSLRGFAVPGYARPCACGPSGGLRRAVLARGGRVSCGRAFLFLLSFRGGVPCLLRSLVRRWSVGSLGASWRRSVVAAGCGPWLRVGAGAVSRWWWRGPVWSWCWWRVGRCRCRRSGPGRGAGWRCGPGWCRVRGCRRGCGAEWRRGGGGGGRPCRFLSALLGVQHVSLECFSSLRGSVVGVVGRVAVTAGYALVVWRRSGAMAPRMGAGLRLVLVVALALVAMVGRGPLNGCGAVAGLGRPCCPLRARMTAPQAAPHLHDISRVLYGAGTIERHLPINQDNERVEFLNHPAIPQAEQDSGNRPAKVRNTDSHNLLWQDAGETPPVACRRAPVHGWNHPHALLLPKPPNPPRPVAVPDLHHFRPAHVHRKVGSQRAPEPAHMRDGPGRMRPAGFEVAVEQKTMTEADGELTAGRGRPVLQ